MTTDSTRSSAPGARTARPLHPDDDAVSGGGLAVRQALLVEELQRLPAGARARRRLSDWTWFALTVVGLTAFSLDVAGGHGAYLHRVEDGLHLFSSGFPGSPAPGTSPLVEIAQQLAPFVVLFLSLKLVTTVFRRQLTRFRARSRSGHVVICGLNEKGFRVAEGFLEAGRRVTCLTTTVDQDLASHLQGRGVLLLDDDPTQESGLRAAAAPRARHIVCSLELDRDNAATAALVAQVARKAPPGSPINVFAHVGDTELAYLLRSATAGLGAVRVQFFDINLIWAHELLRAGPLGDGAAAQVEDCELVVVGTTELARTLVVEAARRWHARHAAGASRLRITVLDPAAGTACDRIRERYPALERCSELVAVERSVDVNLPGDFRALFQTTDSHLAALYLCGSDEGDNLGLALQARRQFEGRGPSIIVPATAWTFRLHDLFGRAASGITPVFYSTRANSLDLLHDSGLEGLAREVHRAYLDSRRGTADFGGRPADVPWRHLEERYRESARANVDEIVSQLESVWYELAPRYDWDEAPVEIDPTQLELLARLEHERWCRERRAAGWEYGPERAPDAQPPRHPLLVPWSELPGQEQKIDRALVAARPGILARAGYQLIRSSEREQLARLLHARHLEARQRSGEELGSTPTHLAWEQLDDEARSGNLAAVDDIGVKLFGIGQRLVAGDAGAPLRLDTDQVERLARHEHGRWCERRRAAGWRYGPVRDDDDQRHPDLVDWEELPEPRRQIDRDHVEALPDLIAAVNRSVVALTDVPPTARASLPQLGQPRRRATLWSLR